MGGGGRGRWGGLDIFFVALIEKSTGGGVRMEIGFIRTWSCGFLSDQRLKRSSGIKNIPLRLQARI